MAQIKKAVFPVAGLGIRFLPATKASPKEMLPLVDKPLIQYVVEEAVASGIKDIVMVTGRGKRAIEDHFDLSAELEQALLQKNEMALLDEVRRITNMVNFSYVRQKQPLGLGHAVLCAKNIICDEPFAVLLGDDIIEGEVLCLARMMEAYEEYGGSILAVDRVGPDKISSYGVIRPQQVSQNFYRVLDLVEKPEPDQAPSDLAVIGRYILTPEIFGLLEKTDFDARGEIQLTDALKKLAADQPVYAILIDGKRHDAGNKLGFLIATVEFALKRLDIGPEFRQYLKSLNL